ncbi:hypothetical protein ZYGR_0AF01420 [Zygosaccharomyces rouxii]|uniref:ATP synthase subunit K, mitochondrial n=1 Tax=Zygosaccharomyces rouxii TaxID=4956 RepID=A0A1Q3A7M1_ZYGRO|nr:hypothetical protein ZYGR_0AF01420 [Zygosaccharomyces rouxii]
MGSAYTIFGKQVQPHILALFTLGSVAGIGVLAGRGGKKDEGPAPANGSANDDINVEKLIDDFVQQESQDKK